MRGYLWVSLGALLAPNEPEENVCFSSGPFWCFLGLLGHASGHLVTILGNLATIFGNRGAILRH